MFSPEQRTRGLHPGFAKAFDLLEVDKNNILGLPGSRSVLFSDLLRNLWTAKNYVFNGFNRTQKPFSDFSSVSGQFKPTTFFA
jgi:hypothetical protein